MTFQERIDHDLKEAMKARQTDRLGVLRMLKASLKNLAIEKHGATGQLDDTDAAAVIRKQVKQRQDSIAEFEKGGRPELAEKEKLELEFLNVYLPKQLGPDEVSAIVKAAIEATGATSRAQMGAVMKVAQEKAAGQVDGKTLSAEVQKQLS